VAVSKLLGAPELKRRLEAVGRAGEGIGRDWGEEAIRALRGQIPRRSGATQDSLHLEPAGELYKVVGSPVVDILDSGIPRAYPIEPKAGAVLRWGSAGSPTFRPRAQHPGMRGRHFRGRAARTALEDTKMADRVITNWNEAA
jgi:hypothetical protein